MSASLYLWLQSLRNRLVCAACLFAFFVMPLHSGEGPAFLSLEEALHIAREASPESIALSSSLREAELSLQELTFPYTTSLDAQAGVSMDFGSDPLEPQFSDSIRLSTGILPGLSASAGYSRIAGADVGFSWQPFGAFDSMRRQQRALDLAQVEADHAALALDLRLMRSYASAAHALAELDFAEAERNLAHSEYEIRRRRAEAGLISMNELEQARRQLISAETAVISSRRQQLERSAELSNLLGVSVIDYRLELPVPLVEEDMLQYETAVSQEGNSSQALEAVRLQNRALESERSLNQAERFWIPSLVLRADARQQDEWLPSARLELRLGIAARDLIQIERARGSHQSLLHEQRIQSEQQRIRAELDELSFALSRASYEAAALDLSLTASDHELAERSLARGVITEIELERSRMSLVRSQYREQTALWQLYLDWLGLKYGL